MQWVAMPGQAPGWDAFSGMDATAHAVAAAAAAAATAQQAPPPPADDLAGNLPDLCGSLETARACHAARAGRPSPSPSPSPGPGPGPAGPGSAAHGAHGAPSAPRAGPAGAPTDGPGGAPGGRGGMVYMQPLPDRPLGYHTHLPALAAGPRARPPPRSSSADNLERRAVRAPALPNGMRYHAPPVSTPLPLAAQAVAATHALAAAPAPGGPLQPPRPQLANGPLQPPRPQLANGPLANVFAPAAPRPAAAAAASAGGHADAPALDPRAPGAGGAGAAPPAEWPPLAPGAPQGAAGSAAGDAGGGTRPHAGGDGAALVPARPPADWPPPRAEERNAAWLPGERGRDVAAGGASENMSPEPGTSVASASSERCGSPHGTGSATSAASPKGVPPPAAAAAAAGAGLELGAAADARGRARADRAGAPGRGPAAGDSPRRLPAGAPPHDAPNNFWLAEEDFPALSAGRKGRRSRGSVDSDPRVGAPGEAAGLAPLAVPRRSWAVGWGPGSGPGDSPPCSAPRPRGDEAGPGEDGAARASGWPGARGAQRQAAGSVSAPATPLAGTSPVRPPLPPAPAAARSPPAELAAGRGRGAPGGAAGALRAGERAWSPSAGQRPAWGGGRGVGRAAAVAAHGDPGAAAEAGAAARAAWGGRGLQAGRGAGERVCRER